MTWPSRENSIISREDEGHVVVEVSKIFDGTTSPVNIPLPAETVIDGEVTKESRPQEFAVRKKNLGSPYSLRGIARWSPARQGMLVI
jgi:hypothetical protein